MAERKIKHALFTYHVEVEDPLQGKGETKVVQRHAFRDEVVDIPMDSDIRKGEHFGAFYTDEELAGQPDVETEPTIVPADMSDEALADWIEEEQPTVQEVVDASGGDPEQAQRLLQAEHDATGGDSRTTLVEGLTAVIQRGNQ